MTPTEELCTDCGLCCDGTLLADVELGDESEAAGLELMGLPIDTDDEPLLPQPCAALKERLCRIYAHRPQACRDFKCKILQLAEKGAVSVADTEATIRRALAIASDLKALCLQGGAEEEHLPLREICSSLLGEDHTRINTAQVRDSMTELDAIVSENFIETPDVQDQSERKS